MFFINLVSNIVLLECNEIQISIIDGTAITYTLLKGINHSMMPFFLK